MAGRRRERRWFAPSMVAAAFALSACYRYTPIAFERVEPGREVRLHLSDSGSVRYANQIGELGSFRAGRQVDGEVVTSSGSQFTLAVRVPGQEGISLLRQRVAIAPGDVSLIQLKALDRKRMTIVGVAGGLIVGAILAHYVSGVFGGNTEPRPGPGSELMPRGR